MSTGRLFLFSNDEAVYGSLKLLRLVFVLLREESRLLREFLCRLETFLPILALPSLLIWALEVGGFVLTFCMDFLLLSWVLYRLSRYFLSADRSFKCSRRSSQPVGQF